MGFFKFMASSAGRITRLGAGVALVVVGFVVVKGTGGTVLGIVGLLPLVAGALDFCALAPLAGLPVAGDTLRKALGPGA